jgi:crotonobetainyl-CoA:carnitine CoA-transferase CaiB-like acyl-CoA transferase
MRPEWPGAAEGSLRGLRVLDLSQQLPGPYATLLLAEQGASVVKVDPPSGDAASRIDPEMHRRLNDRKHTIRVDLKTEAGRSHVLTLAAEAHMVFQSWRPGVAERLGVAPFTLAAVNPRLLVGVITGWGSSGPISGRGAHDLNVQAAVGALDAVASLDRTGVPWADLATGAFAAFAMTAAWQAGDAGLLELGMLDAAAAWTAVKPKAVTVQEPAYGIFASGDGRRFALGVLEDPEWRRLCDGLDWPDLADVGVEERNARFDELRARLNDAVAQLDQAGVAALADRSGVLVTFFDPVDEVTAEQLALRGYGADAERAPQIPAVQPWT